MSSPAKCKFNFEMKSLLGLRLHTVGIIIGWVGVSIFTLSTVACIILLSNVDYIEEAILKATNAQDEYSGAIRAGLITIFAFYLAVALVNIISSALLVYGTIKQRHMYLVPWLTNATILLVSVGASIFIGILSLIFDGVTKGSFAITLGCASCFGLVFIVYTAIRSLYKQIQRANDAKQNDAEQNVNTNVNDYARMKD